MLPRGWWRFGLEMAWEGMFVVFMWAVGVQLNGICCLIRWDILPRMEMVT